MFRRVLAAVVVLLGGAVLLFLNCPPGTDVDRARAVAARAQIADLESILELYRMDSGAYPTTEQGLQALVSRPASHPSPANYPPGGYVKRGSLPLDPWGEPYQYQRPGHHRPESFDLWSLASDRVPGGAGTAADIGNWQERR
jgi:general secretion pathway protein G